MTIDTHDPPDPLEEPIEAIVVEIDDDEEEPATPPPASVVGSAR